MPRAVQIARWIRLRIRAAIAVRERHSIDFTRERRESSLIRMRLAGQRQRHHGAAVKCIFERNDARPLRGCPRNLHRVLNRLGATVHKDGLLRELTGRHFVHALGQTHVTLVWRDLHAGVQEMVELIFYCVHHGFATMAHVEAADAAREIKIAVAIDVFQPCVLSLGDINWRAVRKAAGYSFRAAVCKGLRLRPGNLRSELNCRHRQILVASDQCSVASQSSSVNWPLVTDHWPLVFQYHPIGASFRLMWTCLVSRYSSIPQAPSSRPKPDCLNPPHGAST